MKEYKAGIYLRLSKEDKEKNNDDFEMFYKWLWKNQYLKSYWEML